MILGMMLIAAGLALVIWTVTITYWLLNRKKPAPALPPPPNYEQLVARLAELEGRLRDSEEGRRAVEELRQTEERRRMFREDNGL